MTDRTSTSNPGWNISTRGDGEVLTAGAASRGLHLHLLGVPPGFSAGEIEGWLRDLIGVAHETSREDAEGGAIPSLLHHALTGLLFSHGQLWNQAGGPTPCSFACVVSGRQVAFGWVGDASVQVRVDDEPTEVGWVRVRDDDGRSAQAGAFEVQHAVRIRLYWSTRPGSPDAPGATMVAEWPGAEAAAAAPQATQAKSAWQPPAWMPAAPAGESGPPQLAVDDAEPLMDVLHELEAEPPARESGPPALVVDEIEDPAAFDTTHDALAPELEESEDSDFEHHDPVAPIDEDTLDPLAWKPPAIALGMPRADLRAPGERTERRGPPTLARPVVDERRGAPPARDRLIDEPTLGPGDTIELEEGNASFLDPGATMTPPAPKQTTHLSKPAAGKPVGARRPSAAPRVAPSDDEAGVETQRAPWKPILPPSPSAPWRDAGDEPVEEMPPAEAMPVEHYSEADVPAEAAVVHAPVEPVVEYQPPLTYEPTPGMDPYGVEPTEPRARGFMAWVSSLVPWKKRGRPVRDVAARTEGPAYTPQGVVPDSFGRGANEPVRAGTPTAAAEGFDLDRLFDEPAAAGEPEALAHDVPGVPDLIPPPEAEAYAPEIELEAPSMPPAIEARLQRPAPIAPADDLDVAAAPPALPRSRAKAAPPPAASVAPAPPTLVPPARAATAPAAPRPKRAAAPPPPPVAPEPDEVLDEAELPAAMEPLEAIEIEEAPAPEAGPISEADLLAQTVEFLEPSFESRAPRPPRDPMDAGGSHGAPPRRRMPRAFAPDPGSAIDLEFTETPPVWKRPWLWIALVVALFVGGFAIGVLQSPESGGFAGALRTLGLGGARFQLVVQSRPPGAWIAVDGKDLTRRTPATIDLPPGEHEVTLSFVDHGAASFTVRGERGDREQLDAPLWGSLSIYAADAAMPVQVSVDGEPRGFAPVSVDSLMPGTHEVRFSGPGMPSWGQTIEIRVRETAEIVARSMTSPATGLLEVRSRATGSRGGGDVEGAQVWIDGALQGKTPLSLELPRGPHSIRVAFQGETAPIQLIDLPGGNQRFATFEFGLDLERPAFAPVALPARIPLEQPTVVSAVLRGLEPGELREMWLHVRNGDGTWRRTAMTMLKASEGVVGVGVFPITAFDAKGRSSWYVSAVTTVGDEYYTEISSVESAQR